MTATVIETPTFEDGDPCYHAPRMADVDVYHAICASDRFADVEGPYPARGPAVDRRTRVIGPWGSRGDGHLMGAARKTDAPLGFTAIRCTAPGNTRSEAAAKRMGASCEGDPHHPTIGPLNVWRHFGPEE